MDAGGERRSETDRLLATAAAALLAVPILAGAATALPEDLDVFSSFETSEGFPTNTGGVPFTLGTSPATATFGGDAFAGIIGAKALYRTGTQAWMVNGAGMGTITFETNAAEVQFWSRTSAGASGTTVITAFDDLGAVIGSPITLTPGNPFQLISFIGSIDHIDVVNNDSSLLNSVDDFGFTPVPEPATFAMLSLGLLGLAARRRTRGSQRIRTQRYSLTAGTSSRRGAGG